MDELELTADAETGKPLSVNALAIALAVVIGGGLTVGAALVAVGVFNPHYVLNIVLWPGRVEIHCELPVLNPLYVVNMVLQLAMVPFAWGLWKGSRKAWLYLQLMLGGQPGGRCPGRRHSAGTAAGRHHPVRRLHHPVGLAGGRNRCGHLACRQPSRRV